MCTGNAASYRGETLIGFALIFETVCCDRDLVNFSLPLAHKPCSRFESPPGVILPLGAQRGRKLLQRSLGFGP